MISKGGVWGTVLKIFGPIADRILAIRKLNNRFHAHGLAGLNTQCFLDKVLDLLKVKIDYEPGQLQYIPREGPVVVVANHPFGGVEGIILAALLRRLRPDVKFLVNRMLQSVIELRELFIFTNPLIRNHPENFSSLRNCLDWLGNGHLLVVFPAGRVASYQKGKGMITDAPWNRIAARMVELRHAPVVPIHISGSNSALFHFLGRIYYRFRLLMLPREFLRAKNRTVEIQIGKVIPFNHLSCLNNSKTTTRYLRMRTYLLDRSFSERSPRSEKYYLPIAGSKPSTTLQSEIDSIPKKQKILAFQNVAVYYAYYDQIPQIVEEIARLREITFRELDEGSGQSLDTDRFDKTYIHLFLWDESTLQIIGSYRMGPVDRLLQGGDVNELYLSQLYKFPPSFFSRVSPGLELGRSFIRKEYQKTPYGLFLLLRGIGEFILRHPHYHTLYGNVSLSTCYHPYSLALMSKVLVGENLEVEPVNRFKPILPKEVELYMQKHRLSLKQLSCSVKAIEPNGNDIPILVRQYLSIGVRFHSIAIDRGFGDTPGALITLDLRKALPKTQRLFLGEKSPEYLRHHGIAV